MSKLRFVFHYHVDHSGEINAGIRPFSDEVTVIVNSGEPGGDDVGEDSFQEYMRQCLAEWFDGAGVEYCPLPDGPKEAA